MQVTHIVLLQFNPDVTPEVRENVRLSYTSYHTLYRQVLDI